VKADLKEAGRPSQHLSGDQLRWRTAVRRVPGGTAAAVLVALLTCAPTEHGFPLETYGMVKYAGWTARARSWVMKSSRSNGSFRGGCQRAPQRSETKPCCKLGATSTHFATFFDSRGGAHIASQIYQRYVLLITPLGKYVARPPTQRAAVDTRSGLRPRRHLTSQSLLPRHFEFHESRYDVVEVTARDDCSVISTRRVTGGDTPRRPALSCTATTFCSAAVGGTYHYPTYRLKHAHSGAGMDRSAIPRSADCNIAWRCGHRR
jgi:hypothetical protein